MTIDVRPATVQDAKDLAPRLRRADIEEIKAASGWSPKKALVSGVQISAPHCYSITDDAIVGAIFGACPTGRPGTGAVWLLGSDALVDSPNRYHLLSLSGEWIDKLQHEYPILTNYADARNALHHRWLRWLGFELRGPVPFGVQGLPFYEITRCANRPQWR